MLGYTDTVLFPCMVKQSDHLELTLEAVGLCIFDVCLQHTVF